MTAPAPSPAEQAVIDRFGIFEPEARVVEEVARTGTVGGSCPVSIQWLDDSPATPCVLLRGHDGAHAYGDGS